jgi:hypothetical protein
MARAVTIELPDSLEGLRLPQALDELAPALLDRQDESGSLSSEERREAAGLVDVAELLSVLRTQAQFAAE